MSKFQTLCLYLSVTITVTLSLYHCTLPPPQAENIPADFALCVQHNDGTMEPFREEDTPLMVRLRLGPSEDMAKIYVLEASKARLMEVLEEVWPR